MNELRAILDAARVLQRSGEPALLATVVRVQGSSYRRPGARMLVSGDRWVAGAISGGCLERDVVAKGWWRTRTHPAVVVTYDGTSDDDMRLGSGCNGVIELLIERVAEAAGGPLDAVARCLAEEHEGAMVTVFRSTRPSVPVGARLVLMREGEVVSSVPCERLRAEMVTRARGVLGKGRASSYTSLDGDVDMLVEAVVPPPHLFIVGSGYDAVPVMTLAKAVGWDVTVCDGHASFAATERFATADRRLVVSPASLAAAVDACARPIAVVMAHHYEHDRDALGALLGSRASYIGVLGPRRRTERMLTDLVRAGIHLSDEALRRVHSPVGLHIGAETPEEIALAVVAEVQAARTGTPGSRLRERGGPLHAAGQEEPTETSPDAE